jgi:hypothetical protein
MAPHPLVLSVIEADAFSSVWPQGQLSRLSRDHDLSGFVQGLLGVFEPLGFLGMGGQVALCPWLFYPCLFDWFSSWANLTSWVNAPVYKLWRGGVVGRLASNELNTFSTAFVGGQNFLPAPKNLASASVPRLRLAGGAEFFIEGAPAVLDQEWTFFTHPFALELPTPFEDLDPGFIYRRWAIEVNTTRRADYSVRYQVTSGAFFASKFGRSLSSGVSCLAEPGVFNFEPRALPSF